MLGFTIYEYVCHLAGNVRAPKITGMLIDVSVDEIRDYLGDYKLFKSKVKLANDMIEKAGILVESQPEE